MVFVNGPIHAAPFMPFCCHCMHTMPYHRILMLFKFSAKTFHQPNRIVHIFCFNCCQIVCTFIEGNCNENQAKHERTHIFDFISYTKLALTYAQCLCANCTTHIRLAYGSSHSGTFTSNPFHFWCWWRYRSARNCSDVSFFYLKMKFEFLLSRRWCWCVHQQKNEHYHFPTGYFYNGYSLLLILS